MARQAGHRRRRPARARRGLDLLLRGASLRRPFGDAEPHRLRALPAGDLRQAAHARLPRGVAAGVRGARALFALRRGRLRRRGLPGHQRNGASLRRRARAGRTAADGSPRGDGARLLRGHRAEPPAREDRQRGGEAGRPVRRAVRARRGPGLARPAAGEDPLGRGEADERGAREVRLPHLRRPAGGRPALPAHDPRGRGRGIDPDARRGRGLHPGRGRGGGREERLAGVHVRRGRIRPRGRPAPPTSAVRRPFS